VSRRVSQPRACAPASRGRSRAAEHGRDRGGAPAADYSAARSTRTRSATPPPGRDRHQRLGDAVSARVRDVAGRPRELAEGPAHHALLGRPEQEGVVHGADAAPDVAERVPGYAPHGVAPKANTTPGHTFTPTVP
jgi:hypothetical protein